MDDQRPEGWIEFEMCPEDGCCCIEGHSGAHWFDPPPLSDARVESIKQGIAEAKAGKTIPLTEVLAGLRLDGDDDE